MVRYSTGSKNLDLQVALDKITKVMMVHPLGIMIISANSKLICHTVRKCI